MRIRSTYFKVAEMETALGFWSSFLLREHVKQSAFWSEFLVGEIRLGLLLNDFGEEIRGSACVPVLELPADEIAVAVARAKWLGATVVLDGLDNPKMNGIVMATPTGQEFEFAACR